VTSASQHFWIRWSAAAIADNDDLCMIDVAYGADNMVTGVTAVDKNSQTTAPTADTTDDAVVNYKAGKGWVLIEVTLYAGTDAATEDLVSKATIQSVYWGMTATTETTDQSGEEAADLTTGAYDYSTGNSGTHTTFANLVGIEHWGLTSSVSWKAAATNDVTFSYIGPAD
jgi:hypothetical protein